MGKRKTTQTYLDKSINRYLKDERRREKIFLSNLEDSLRGIGVSEDRIQQQVKDARDSLAAVRDRYAPETAEYEAERANVVEQLRDIASQLIANEGINIPAAPEALSEGEVQPVESAPTPEAPPEESPLQEVAQSLEETQDKPTDAIAVGDEPYQGELDPADIQFDNFLDSNEVPVNSTNLASVNYDASTSTLRISFHKGRGYYYYGDVSYTEYQGLINADSVGKYFHQRIKQKTYFIR